MFAFVLGVFLVAFWSSLPPREILLIPALLILAVVWLFRAGNSLAADRTGWISGGISGRCNRGRAGERISKKTCCRAASSFIAIISAVAFLLAGMAWHVGFAQAQLDRRLPEALEGQDILVTGYVASIPERAIGVQRFQFQIEASPSGFSPRRVLLNTYGEESFRAGQVWQLQLRLQRPHGFANPGTFDYEGWLLQQRISARGYVRESDSNRYLGEDRYRLSSLRSGLRKRLLEVTGGLTHQALILALALGDRSGLTDDQWQLFSSSGTNHLVVISGLHVALVAGLCGLLTARFWRLGTVTLEWLPAPHAGALGAITGALVYSLLSGFQLPAQRALVMVTVFMSSRLLGLNSSPAFSLLAAAVLVLLLNPLAVSGAGFWLSFGAVSALLLVFTGIPLVGNNRFKQVWLALVAPQLVVLVGLLVPLGFWIGSISLLAPLANLLAIPLVSWVLVPLCLAGAVLAVCWPVAAKLVFRVADGAAATLVSWLEWLIDSLFALGGWSVNGMAPGLLLLPVVGTLLLLIPGSSYYRLLGCCMLLPYLWPGRATPSGPALAMHVLDVGQGLAVIVQTPRHTLVYDAGPRYPSGFDSGSALLEPVLRHLGIRRLDYLVISHADNDHSGGAVALLNALPVEQVLVGEPLEGLPVPAEACEKGQAWRFDRVDFRMLHPSADFKDTGNNSSCVLEVSVDDFRVLLPGDVEAEVERRLASAEEGMVRQNVVVSPHHGSNTSSTWTFLAVTQPELVIHSAGYRNQFGHPAARVRDRIEKMGAAQLSTARSGMISLNYAGSGELQIRTYRQTYNRYWHWSEFPLSGR